MYLPISPTPSSLEIDREYETLLFSLPFRFPRLFNYSLCICTFICIFDADLCLYEFRLHRERENVCIHTQTHARLAHPFTYTWSQFACGKTKECNNCTTLHTLRTYTLTSLTHCIQTMQMQIRLRLLLLLLLLLDRWYLSKTTVSKCIHVRPFALISLLNIFQFICLRWLRLIPFDLCDMTRTYEKPIYQAGYWLAHALTIQAIAHVSHIYSK